MLPITAVFPVGGFGTRFLPATKSVPKEMLPIVDKPLIQYGVEEAKAAGFSKFVFVTSRGKQPIEDHFDVQPELENALKERQKWDLLEELNQLNLLPGQVAFTRQPHPLGLGHALWCARHYIQEDVFAVSLPDDLIMASPTCLEQMLQVYREKPGIILAIMAVPQEQTSLYGIIDPIDQEGSIVRVGSIVEKPAPHEAPSCLAVVGRYILPTSIFQILEHQCQGAGGEIQLTDAIAKLIQEMPVYGCIFKGQRFDCGIKTGFIEANVAFAMQRPDMAKILKPKLQGWINV